MSLCANAMLPVLSLSTNDTTASGDGCKNVRTPVTTTAQSSPPINDRIPFPVNVADHPDLATIQRLKDQIDKSTSSQNSGRAIEYFNHFHSVSFQFNMSKT
ncbi:hypothetical protein V6N13_098077 [Hibiscus sabdariffa]|uniref:Uncharacterized protein n=1 Tax=Hibiscus sabdariffa TaxID=183260 RepID=A0ABR2NVM9_9ROSI